MITEPLSSQVKSPSGMALFRYGFRPFFLLGPLFGMAALGYFILWMSGIVTGWYSAWDALVWHRHEMLFGYTGAIIAGFLFTAVPNWTGHPTPKDTRLALAVLLWFAGRAAVFFSAHLPASLVTVVDSSFFLACAAGILPALVKSKNRRNYFFIVLLVLLAMANGFTHWEDEDSADIADMGIRLALGIVILMMVLIGGRVIPFFTERPLGITITRNPGIERFTLVSTIAALVLSIADAPGNILGVAFLLAAIANGWRLSQWQSLRTRGTPLLWVLHAGYAWLVMGFSIAAGGHLGLPIPAIAVTHAFTAGGVSVLTLGMMARVSLGHSGRPLDVRKPMVWAFRFVNMAAAFRVFGVWLFPELTMRWLEASSLLWLLAFGIFVVVYAPILMRPRMDGRDG
jgi:uncharacterized protein involved in response to NO